MEVEKRIIENYLNFHQYGTYGFRVIMNPSPLTAPFVNTKAFNTLVGTIDTGPKLRLEDEKIGPNTFNHSLGGNIDLSSFLINIGGLLVMIWAFSTFRDIEFIRYMNNFLSTGKVFLAILVGRLIWLTAAVFIVLIVVCLQFLANGITLNASQSQYLAVYFFIFLLVMVFFSLISAALGTLRKPLYGGMAIALIWVIVVFLWPAIINLQFSIISGKSLKSMSNIECKKLKIITDKLEKEAFKNTQRYTKIEDKLRFERKAAEYYWNNIFKEVEAIDLGMVRDTEAMAKRIHLSALINPVTFLIASGNEISSLGFKSYLQVYLGNIERQKEFLRFIFNNRIYHNYTKVYPFIPPEKALIPVKPHLPYYFPYGVSLLLVYVLLAGILANYRFKRQLFPILKNCEFYRQDDCLENKPFVLDLHPHKHMLLSIEEDSDIKNVFINSLSGIKGFHGLIRLNGKPLDGDRVDYHYIPRLDVLPGNATIDTFYGFVKLTPPAAIKGKTYSSLSRSEKLTMLLEIAIRKNATVYILDEFVNRFYHEAKSQLIPKIQQIKNGSSLIEFSTRTYWVAPDSSFVVEQEKNKFTFGSIYNE
ncbi:MAG: hypothetical protein ACM3SY_14555 [Candidatus Omnitrophota bacterium]